MILIFVNLVAVLPPYPKCVCVFVCVRFVIDSLGVCFFLRQHKRLSKKEDLMEKKGTWSQETFFNETRERLDYTTRNVTSKSKRKWFTSSSFAAAATVSISMEWRTQKNQRLLHMIWSAPFRVPFCIIIHRYIHISIPHLDVLICPIYALLVLSQSCLPNSIVYCWFCLFEKKTWSCKWQ